MKKKGKFLNFVKSFNMFELVWLGSVVVLLTIFMVFLKDEVLEDSSNTLMVVCSIISVLANPICELMISKQNKYRIIKTKKSTGGLSDYVSDTYRVPSATIELGRNVLTHPIMEDKLSEIFEKNKTIPETALAFLSKI